MKKIARKYFYPLALRLGIDKLVLALSKKKFAILMYHGVTEHDYTAINPRHLMTGEFEKHIVHLKTRFDIVPLQKIFEMYKSGKMPGRHTIAITFDDGYVNNLQSALPILEKYKVPASFFISGICAEDEHYVLWYDMIEMIRYTVKDDHVMIGGKPFLKTGKYGLYNTADNQGAFEYVKRMAPGERSAMLKELAEKYNLPALVTQMPPECYKLLNIAQLKELASSPLVEIGGHGHTHLNLGNIPLADVHHELQRSKQVLETVTGVQVLSVAYPDGSYSEEVKKASLAEGYQYLLAVNYLLPGDRNDKHILSRFGISNTTTFEANMLKLSLYLAQSKGF